MTQFNPTSLKRIKQRADQLIEAQQFPGICWNIEVKGRTVEQGCSGMQCVDSERPLHSDSIFRIYSMTKPIVAVRCLQLIEEGRLRLGDSINRWLPEFSEQKVLNQDGKLEARHRSITVEDLLMHRSGLSYDFLPNCAVADLYRNAELAADGSRTLSELTSCLAQFPLASQPGKRWLYSYSTDVLAQLLEKVTDKDLAELLQEGIFAPLDMTDTGFYVPEEKQHRLATMYGQRSLGEVDYLEFTSNRLNKMDVSASYPCDINSGFRRGGLGLFSTIGDYSRFAEALITERKLLSSPMINFLWHNRLSNQQMPIAVGNHPLPGYGWGLVGRVMSDLNKALWLTSPSEGGWAGAAATYFWVDRQYQFTGVVMTQYLGTAVPLGLDIQSLAYSAIE